MCSNAYEGCRTKQKIQFSLTAEFMPYVYEDVQEKDA